jgi:hypothetical protein
MEPVEDDARVHHGQWMPDQSPGLSRKAHLKGHHLKGKPRIRINEKIINNLTYANDTVMLAEREQELQELVNAVYYKRHKYCMNIQKTKTMITGKTQSLTINKRDKIGNDEAPLMGEGGWH